MMRRFLGYFGHPSANSVDMAPARAQPGRQSRSPAAELATESLALDGCRVLVVDDDPKITTLMTEVLQPLGLEVLPACSAAEARRLLNRLPDLALLDVNLGATSGFDLLAELRRRSTIPVILLTGRTSEADVEHGLALGADDYVRKPFNVRELVARVERQIRRG